jgi:hypothetical protein
MPAFLLSDDEINNAELTATASRTRKQTHHEAALWLVRHMSGFGAGSACYVLSGKLFALNNAPNNAVDNYGKQKGQNYRA